METHSTRKGSPKREGFDRRVISVHAVYMSNFSVTKPRTNVVCLFIYFSQYHLLDLHIRSRRTGQNEWFTTKGGKHKSARCRDYVRAAPKQKQGAYQPREHFIAQIVCLWNAKKLTILRAWHTWCNIIPWTYQLFLLPYKVFHFSSWVCANAADLGRLVETFEHEPSLLETCTLGIRYSNGFARSTQQSFASNLPTLWYALPIHERKTYEKECNIFDRSLSLRCVFRKIHAKFLRKMLNYFLVVTTDEHVEQS